VGKRSSSFVPEKTHAAAGKGEEKDYIGLILNMNEVASETKQVCRDKNEIATDQQWTTTKPVTAPVTVQPAPNPSAQVRTV
jgi:hypothetical protein